MAHYIGFYGTLRNYVGPDLEYDHDDVIPDAMLWDLGPFPGYTKDIYGNGRDVNVRVFYIIGGPTVLERFDRYEGVPHLYTRELISSRKGDFYAYKLVNTDGATLIPEGDWNP